MSNVECVAYVFEKLNETELNQESEITIQEQDMYQGKFMNQSTFDLFTYELGRGSAIFPGETTSYSFLIFD